MAVSATFQADFSNFKREVDDSVAKLHGLAEGASKVGPAVDRAVGKAPDDFKRLGNAAADSGRQLNTLHGSVDQVDRVLNAAGISLGPIPGALKELSAAAGKTASELGGLATGALTVSAAFAGWNVGRMIAEFAGTDQIIGDATASLMGWGNVAKEEAAAGADLLARATKLAGREIANFDEALKISREGAFVPYTERLKGAEIELGKLTESQKAGIEAAQRIGASTKELTEHYHISEGALKLLGERTRDQEKAEREAEAAKKKLAEETRRYRDALTELNASGNDWRNALEGISPVIQDQIKWYLEAGVSQGSLAEAYQLTALQIKGVAKALEDEQEAAEEAGKAHEKWAQSQLKASQEAGKLWDDYHSMRVAQGGTAVDQQIEQVERWKRESIAKLKEAGEYNEETYTAIEAVAKLKLEAVSVDWGVVSEGSKRALEQTAAKAEATFNYINDHADQFTPKQIEAHRKIAEEARKAVDQWGLDYITTFDEVQAKSKETADAVVRDTLSWSEAMEQVRQGKGTMTGTVMAGGTIDRGKIEQLFAEGKYSGPIKNYTTDAWGRRIGGQIDWDAIGGGGVPKRAMGGPVTGGKAYVVGESGAELFVPGTSGSILPSGDMGGRGLSTGDAWQQAKAAAERIKDAMASIDRERSTLLNRALSEEEKARANTLDAEWDMLKQGLDTRESMRAIDAERQQLMGRELSDAEKARVAELDTVWDTHREQLVAGFERIRAAGAGAYGDILKAAVAMVTGGPLTPTLGKGVGGPLTPALGKGVGGPLTPALGKGVGGPLIGVPGGTLIDTGGLALPMPTAKTTTTKATTFAQEQNDWALAQRNRMLSGNTMTPIGSINFAPVFNGPVLGGNRSAVAKELFDMFTDYMKSLGYKLPTAA